MTVSQSIIDWLKSYTTGNIDTDRLAATSISYGLAKTPQQTKKTDVLGNKTYIDSYTFMARFDTATDMERISNQDYLEKLTEWIEDQSDQDKYPILENGTCTGVTVSVPFYLESQSGDTSVYLMTINITYRKERNNG